MTQSTTNWQTKNSFLIIENSECNEITNWQFEADFWPSLKLFSTKWHHLNTWTDLCGNAKCSVLWPNMLQLVNTILCLFLLAACEYYTMAVSVGSLWILYYGCFCWHLVNTILWLFLLAACEYYTMAVSVGSLWILYYGCFCWQLVNTILWLFLLAACEYYTMAVSVGSLWLLYYDCFCWQLVTTILWLFLLAACEYYTMTVSVGSLWILYYDYAFRSTIPLPAPHLYNS